MYLRQTTLYERLKANKHRFHQVVPFNPEKEKLIQFDFTEKNTELEKVNPDDTEIFSKYINGLLRNTNAKFGYGGYNELRTFYKRSNIFNCNLTANITGQPIEEPRRLHLGIDIWG